MASTATLTDNGDGTTGITIQVTVPIADVASAISVIAAQLGYAGCPPDVPEIEFVASQTRQWWQSFAKQAALAQAEAQAQAAADAARQAALDAIEANPLFKSA